MWYNNKKYGNNSHLLIRRSIRNHRGKTHFIAVLFPFFILLWRSTHTFKRIYNNIFTIHLLFVFKKVYRINSTYISIYYVYMNVEDGEICCNDKENRTEHYDTKVYYTHIQTFRPETVSNFMSCNICFP